MSISLVIPYTFGELFLQQTVDSFVKNSDGDIEVIQARGVSGVDIQRTEGIMRARHDIICVVDAHCLAQPGWSSQVEKNFTETGMFCAACERGSIREFFFSDKHEAHYGASLIPFCSYGIKGMSARWISHQPTTPTFIPCLLGGFYCFSKRHFMDALKSPWAVMRSYGCSEEVVSIMQWKLGFDVKVIPGIRILHAFREECGPPYIQDWAEMKQNRYLQHAIAADTKEEYEELMAPLELPCNDPEKILDSFRLEKFLQIRRMLVSNQKRSFKDLMKWSATFTLRTKGKGQS